MPDSPYLAPPGGQFGSALPGRRLGLIAALAAALAAAAMASAPPASGAVQGYFCGSQPSPRTYGPGAGCTHSAPHLLTTVVVNATVPWANMCATAKDNPYGTGHNLIPAACGEVGQYGQYATCEGYCYGYARTLNQNTVTRYGWGYLYA